ncbi:MAG TPA: hypothetical protein VGM60_25405 [Pseudonocardia sp.]|uniref:hypothetical protein n=1 Tax=Pseudonocardia sp. TaxID=60912 RepID=UPI002F42DC20
MAAADPLAPGTTRTDRRRAGRLGYPAWAPTGSVGGRVDIPPAAQVIRQLLRWLSTALTALTALTMVDQERSSWPAGPETDVTSMVTRTHAPATEGHGPARVRTDAIGQAP